jgi:hypothetical protein
MRCQTLVRSSDEFSNIRACILLTSYEGMDSTLDCYLGHSGGRPLI